ncbi:alpha/beta hydrolase [Nocardioides anomalus]|uniref:Alpha/beta hydrolase n=1 Tax=Nocardioides anomalus TaxID=2712223 RepID=A0A6G6WJA3_9ACTN|nr:alpha/beta hydrolase [Nocardioides anomalus]QIG45286.1 alpha/beta hydrolase [Nocardioides anomalus]
MRRASDLAAAALMHASARFTVRYGADLRFAGRDLPRPRRVRATTRYGTVPVRVYGELGSPTYVHSHGGAWLMRHPGMDDFWCRYVAARAGVSVVNVDFRAAPYVTYPVAQHEVHDAAAWVAGHGAPVAVGGFSSGGGLAAAACLQARDRGSFEPVLQVLGVPALDLASPVDPDVPGMVSPSLRGLVRRVYFPDPTTRAAAYASPVLAPDLSRLPPAVVLTAERDALRADGLRYVERLRAAGTDVVHDETPGADHYFLTADLDRARTTMALAAVEIARRLHAP